MVLFARCGSLIGALGALGLVAGCSSVPTFPPLPHDAGTQCSATQPCPSGQNCLQGLCYAACDMTHPCSANEVCTSGVCMAGTRDAGPPPRDAGSDAGPCAVLRCGTPTPICRGDIASCVQCDATNRDECGTTTGPVCDVGRGTCTAGAPAICAPCNAVADCPTGFTCVTRTAPEAQERVCLPGCSSTACSDQGFSCQNPVCVPFVRSCTAYRSALAHRPCTVDADCPQRGATIDNGLVDGMCFDDGGGAGRTCHAACGLSTDCPPGMTCTSGFCR